MDTNNDFTHFNNNGRAYMVDVGVKNITHRTAKAGAKVYVNENTFNLIKSGGMKKGDVLTVAQIAGIMAAKKNFEIIPMCHPINITHINIEFNMDEKNNCIEIESVVECDYKTGVEMESLTACSVAALTIYDMCKAVQKDIVISDIRLLDKTGGIHGEYHRQKD